MRCQALTEGRFLDLIEIDAASNTSVDDVRDLRDKINFAPNEGRYKVYIVDEVHMLSTAAFNALLKTLEEPPAHAIFVLATTEIHKIPATVLSRCQRHEFRRLPVAIIVDYLSAKLSQEGLQAEPGVLELVARQATGSMRDAISLLDQLGSAGEVIALLQTQVVLGTATGQAVRQVIDALLAKDVALGLTLINRALDGGADPRQFARQVVDYLRGLLLARMGDAHLLEATPEDRAEMARQAQRFEVPELLAANSGLQSGGAGIPGRMAAEPASGDGLYRSGAGQAGRCRNAAGFACERFARTAQRLREWAEPCPLDGRQERQTCKSWPCLPGIQGDRAGGVCLPTIGGRPGEGDVPDDSGSLA